MAGLYGAVALSFVFAMCAKRDELLKPASSAEEDCRNMLGSWISTVFFLSVYTLICTVLINAIINKLHIKTQKGLYVSRMFITHIFILI